MLFEHAVVGKLPFAHRVGDRLRAVVEIVPHVPFERLHFAFGTDEDRRQTNAGPRAAQFGQAERADAANLVVGHAGFALVDLADGFRLVAVEGERIPGDDRGANQSAVSL